MDEEHITLQAPIYNGSQYYNYKDHFSTVFFLIDDNYNFLFVNIGCQGRILDGTVFQNSELYQKIICNTMHLAPENPIYSRLKYIPHLFLADATFSLIENIIRSHSEVH